MKRSLLVFALVVPVAVIAQAPSQQIWLSTDIQAPAIGVPSSSTTVPEMCAAGTRMKSMPAVTALGATVTAVAS
jgi:hypothetical protein